MEFRRLTADEIEVRVQSSKEAGSILLLYKTARTDAAILEESGVVWTNDYKVIDGVLFGGIGIYDEDLEQFIWKWDCGVESNTEAEKGRASDAFKRAGFKWGIGRELYSSPFIYIKHYDGEVKTYTDKNGKKKYSIDTNFFVNQISYDSKGRIETLQILDDNGNLRYDFRNGASQYIKEQSATQAEPPKNQPMEKPKKLSIGQEVNEYYSKGGIYETTIKEFIDFAGVKKFGELAETQKQELVKMLRGIK